MKLILSESNRSEFNTLSKYLESWGFQVIDKRSESSIVAAVKTTHDIGVVMVGEGEIRIEQLKKRLLKLRPGIFVLLLASDIDGFDGSQADFILKKPLDTDRLKIQLYGIKKAIEIAQMDAYGKSSQPSASLKTQILNLRSIEQGFKGNRALFRLELNSLVEQLRSPDLPSALSEPAFWRDVLSRSERLGCDQLSDWITGVLFLQHHSDLIHYFSTRLVNSHLINMVQSIEQAASSLNEFGFFDESSDSAPKNILEGKHVLLVEDMQYNRMLLKKILQKQNCIIHEATNGEHALESWKNAEHIDVIIMDMNMPVMDGFTATRYIREIEAEQALKRTPVIALTALAMRGDKELCLEAGTDDYLPKPVEAQSLIETCQRLLTSEHSSDPARRGYYADLAIKHVLVKTADHLARYCLDALFKNLGIDVVVCEDTKSVLNAIVEDSFDLIILDADSDLELAYFISQQTGQQQISLIRVKQGADGGIPQKDSENIIFPFKYDQCVKVLQTFSEKQKQVKKDAEQQADMDSLGKINRKANIEEAVQKSDSQLAVWQKAFRKIGGDLVLSHQFNMHGKFGLILGDVAGHDIQSGYTASWFSGLVQGIWSQHSNPYHFLIKLNNRFAHDAEEENKRFVCALVLLWDPLRELLHYANAGIPGGILIKKDTGKSQSMDWKGVPIGMFPDMDMFDHGHVEFKEGDRLIVATDGVLESIPREIISDLSESSVGKTAQQTLDVIVDFVTRSIEIIDDLTIAVFEGRVPKTPKYGYRESIRSDFQEVDAAISRMEDYLQQTSADRFDWSMISVAVREALINAVEHGNKNDAELPVDIDVELNDQSLVITVSDSGCGFDLSSEKERLAKEGDLRIHGRGIEMMENIGRSVAFLGGGIRIEFGEKRSN